MLGTPLRAWRPFLLPLWEKGRRELASPLSLLEREYSFSSPRPAFRRLAIVKERSLLRGATRTLSRSVSYGKRTHGGAPSEWKTHGTPPCVRRCFRPSAWLRAFVAPRAIAMALGRPFRAVAPHPWSGAVSHLAVLAPCARWGAPAPFPDPGVRGDACYGGRSRHWRRRKPKPSPGDLPASFGPGLGGSSPSREHLSSRPTRHPSAFGSYFAHRRF